MDLEAAKGSVLLRRNRRMMSSQFFQRALPVWPAGGSGAMNVRVSFHARIAGRRGLRLTIRIAAASAYRLWVDGRFSGQGPARAPHGHARVDVWNAGMRRNGPVDVVIEVVDYGVPTFCEARGPAFCQAEVEAAGEVLAWTEGAAGGFVAEWRPEVVQRIERYSYQRAFCEGYRLGTEGLAWLQPGYEPARPARLRALARSRVLLERGVSYPDFAEFLPRPAVDRGRASFRRAIASRARKHRFLHNIGGVNHKLPSSAAEGADYCSDGFPLSEVGWPLYETLAGLRFVAGGRRQGRRILLKRREWARWDFGRNLTGFPGLELRAARRARVVILFDEILVEGNIQFDRLECLNAMWLEISPGDPVLFRSFEPYVLRHLQVLVWEGEVMVSGVHLRSFANTVPLRASRRKLSPALAGVREAALATFRQNTLDLYMDCPSRERAGWLGDSLFASRAEWHLCGDNPVERAFLENFLRPRRFHGLPAGMVPMCYPAEPLGGEFIPDFAMFLVLQLDEAQRLRRLPREWRDLVAHRVRGLLRYFRRFENEFGLLENLEGWVFVEWTDGPTVKWEVDSSTSPGEYKFKVTKIEQAYKACPQGWTGGVASKSNTQESDEVTVLAFKIEITGSHQAIESQDSNEFEAKVTPAAANPSAHKWLDGAPDAWPNGAGNNPQLDYSAPQANKTKVKKTRWFAPTNNRRQDIDARLSKIILSWTTGIDFMRAEGTQKAVFE